MKVLGLINARGGSKGVPRKNIKPLCGKPLISWSINAALKSKFINRLIVSTDDQEIANVSKAIGAEVPFLRPSSLAADNSLQIDSIKHAINFVEAEGESYEIIVVLQPTTPLRKTSDIDGSLKLLIDSGADSVISVCDVGGKHPSTLYLKSSSTKIEPYINSNKKGVLRQQFNEVLWRNGAIYAMKRDVLMKMNSLYGDNIVGYKMEEKNSFNIDTLFDWELTESYLRFMDTENI